ncbi:putative tetratricopeptide-like helical domain superfamily [Dioscorea sansibarensis]
MFAKPLKFLKSISGNEEIILQAIISNLKLQQWRSLRRLSPLLTDSIVHRFILSSFSSSSPHIALRFFNFATHSLPLSLHCHCALLHLLCSAKMFDAALPVIRRLILEHRVRPLLLLQSLTQTNTSLTSTPAVFDALIRACTQINAGDDAYAVILKLRSEGFLISIHAWNNFLNHALMSSHDTSRFWELFNEMLSFGYLENVNTYNLVIFALCRDCRVLEAFSVMYRMLKLGFVPNAVTYNMLVDGCCRNGEVDLALQLVEKISLVSGGRVEPNAVTFNGILNGLCKAGKLDIAERVFREDIKEPNVRSYATLINGYARDGQMVNALKGYAEQASVFLSDIMQCFVFPDRFTYSTIIDSCCRNGDLREAVGFYRRIREESLVIDSVPYNSLINFLCKHGKFREARQLLGSMITSGSAPDVVTYTSLIDGYCKRSRLGDALETYDGMVKSGEKPNLVTYNAFVHGLCKAESVDVAKHVAENTKMDVFTCNTLMNGYCSSMRIEEALNLYEEMRERGVMVNVVTYNVLINHLCKLKCFQEAKELMKVMCKRGLIPDCITYTTLITEFCRHCNASEAIELHDYMVLKGVPVDQHAQNTIKLLIQREGLPDEIGSIDE